MMNILFALFCGMSSYPIDPVYFSELMDRSDVVVYGEVKEIVSVKPADENHMEYSIATIIVEKELKKGLPQNAEIKISYSPFMICPEPPAYVKGKKVLAFLRKGKKSYSTVGRSYGTKYIEDEAVVAVLKRLSEYQSLVDANKGRDLVDNKIDWLIDNVSIPLFSHDAQMQLRRYFNPNRKKRNRNNKAQISQSDFDLQHRERLKGLIVNGKLNFSNFYDLYDQDDEALTEILVEQLEDFIDNGYSYLARNVAELLLHKDERQTVIKAIEDHKEYRCDNSDDARLMKRLTQFVDQLRMEYPADKMKALYTYPRKRARFRSRKSMIHSGPYSKMYGRY